MVAILGDAHVAGSDAGDRIVLEQNFRGGKARIDFDAERFGLVRQIAADIAERNDEIAVIAHQRRHQRERQPQRSRSAERVEAVGGDFGLDGRIFAAPFRNETVEADRIDHRAGEDMRADLGALLDHDDGFVRCELLEPDRGGEAGRPGTDDHGIEFHRLPGRKLRRIHDMLRIPVDSR